MFTSTPKISQVSHNVIDGEGSRFTIVVEKSWEIIYSINCIIN